MACSNSVIEILKLTGGRSFGCDRSKPNPPWVIFVCVGEVVSVCVSCSRIQEECPRLRQLLFPSSDFHVQFPGARLSFRTETDDGLLRNSTNLSTYLDNTASWILVKRKTFQKLVVRFELKLFEIDFSFIQKLEQLSTDNSCEGILLVYHMVW